MLHVDCFYGYLHCRLAPVDTPKFMLYIVDFYVWWTQPMPFYYYFATTVPKVVIPIESPSLSMHNEMSSTGSDSSFDDSEDTPLF